MGDDRANLIGKWEVRFLKWVWEYEFSDDQSVTWRDPANGLNGSGQWLLQGMLVNIAWSKSSTRESWRCPITPAAQAGWVAADYGTGPSKARKLPEKAATPQPYVNPDIANLTFESYVDNFETCVYDLNYRIPPTESFAYSPYLQLTYAGGKRLDIALADIGDTPLGPGKTQEAMAHGFVGAMARVFPQVMSPSTTPRLYSAKQDALALQNEDFKLFASVAIAGVSFVLTVPTMPAGAMPAIGTKVGRTRVPGVARTAASTISEAELAAINAIRKDPQFARLTIEEVAALRSYTGEGWAQINMYLRNGSGGPQAKAEADALMAGLRKLPGYSGKLTRSEAGAVSDMTARYVKGQKFVNQGALSTSRGGAVAQREGNVAITIHAIGKNGKDITKASVHAGKEFEVLFPKGTEFMVENVQQFGQALMVVLREL